ncbi:hypothetical protein RIF29_33008 [Crotalaria pallida]|uniref:Uncharacterized protein n=1 Tax=Crotalaria pallida TaxID=3830 RepID=A0AAN9E9H7_CROPI
MRVAIRPLHCISFISHCIATASVDANAAHRNRLHPILLSCLLPCHASSPRGFPNLPSMVVLEMMAAMAVEELEMPLALVTRVMVIVDRGCNNGSCGGNGGPLMVNLASIDTSGIASLEELHNEIFVSNLAIANPMWEVIYKLKTIKFVKRIGRRIFLYVGEATDSKLDC